MGFLLIKKRFFETFFCFRFVFCVICFIFLILPFNVKGAQISYTLDGTSPSTSIFKPMTAGSFFRGETDPTTTTRLTSYHSISNLIPNALFSFQIKDGSNAVLPFNASDYSRYYGLKWMVLKLSDPSFGNSTYSLPFGADSQILPDNQTIQIVLPSAYGEYYFCAYTHITNPAPAPATLQYYFLKFVISAADATLGTRVTSLETSVGALTPLTTSVGNLTASVAALTPLITSVDKFSNYFSSDEDDVIFYSLFASDLNAYTPNTNYYADVSGTKYVPFIYQALNGSTFTTTLKFDSLKGYLINPDPTLSLSEDTIKISVIMGLIKTNNVSISNKDYRTCFRILQRISWLQALAVHLKTKSTTNELIGSTSSQDVKKISDILSDILCFKPGVGFGPNGEYKSVVLDAIQIATTPTNSVKDTLNAYIRAWMSDSANWSSGGLSLAAISGIKGALGIPS